MATVGEVLIKVRADVSQFAKELRDGVGAAADQASKTVSQKFKDMGQSLESTGKSLSKNVTLPIVGIGAAALAVSKDFDTSMTRIQALVGLSAQEVDGMRDSVRELAGQTARSPGELAEALFFVTSAGLRGKDALEALEFSAKASAIGLGDTKVVADLVTSAMNAYGSEVLNAQAATDALTMAVRLGKLEPSQLAGAMGQVLPIASAMGVSFQDVGAAFAAMSRTGTNANVAATQLRGIMNTILSPTQQARDALKDVGLSAEGLQQSLRDKGLLATLEDIVVAFDGNVTATEQVFGNVRALSGVMDMLGSNVEDTREIFAGMNDALGVTDEAFAIMSETAQFKFDQAMTDVKDTLLEVGQVILPVFAQAMEKASGIVRRVREAFANLSPAQKQFVIGLAGAAAAVGPVLIVVGKLFKAVGSIIPVVGSLVKVFALLFNPIGLIVAGVAALVAGFIYAYRNFEGFRNVVDSVVQAVVGFVREAIPVVMEFVGKVVEVVKQVASVLVDAFQAALPTILTVIEVVKNVVMTVVPPIFDALKKVVETFIKVVTVQFKVFFRVLTTLWNVLRTVVPPIFNAIRTVIETAFRVIRAIATPVLEYLAAAWDVIRAVAVPVIETLQVYWDIFAAALAAGWSYFTDLWDAAWPIISAVAEAVIDLLTSAWDVFVTHLTTAWRVFQAVWDVAWPIIQTVATKVIDGVRGVFDKAMKVMTGIMRTLQIAITVAWNLIRGHVEMVINGIRTAFDVASSVMRTIMDTLRSVITTAWNTLRGPVEGVINGIRSTFSTAWGVIQSVMNTTKSVIESAWRGIKTVVEPIINGIRAVWDTATGAIKTAAGGVREFVTSAFETIKRIGENIFNGLAGTIRGAFDRAVSGVRSALNTAIDLANRAIRGINSLPGVSIPPIPRLANGAIVTQPTLALVGEAGPEAVIPLSRPRRAMELLEQSGMLASLAGNMSGGGTVTQMPSRMGPAVNIQKATFVTPMDADAIAQKVIVAERARSLAS
jgi:TP901 family phage tail tape measure protein